MSGATTPGGPLRRRRPVALALPTLALAASLFGVSACGNPAPQPVSPVVAIDSEEARKALAEDRANRELLKKKEAKAASRKKNLVIPSEPE